MIEQRMDKANNKPIPWKLTIDLKAFFTLKESSQITGAELQKPEGLVYHKIMNILLIIA
jgi:hypothetical protein